ncbi:MAG: class I SAM-dependent methyltransferase [Planctomycetes bacterium]|nr:class I SAM-dependent methyltransferase [Planctomycetota bacterium]
MEDPRAPAVTEVRVAPATDDPELAETAHRIAGRLELPESPPADEAPVDPDMLLLVVTVDGLELREGTDPRERGARPDLDRIELRVGTGNLSRKQPIARAVGRDVETVVDATAGLGHDAALLALMGYEVTAVERSPVLAALFADGLDRARDSAEFRAAIGDRLHAIIGDAHDVLPRLEPAPDTVYIDPMFPPRRKASALPKKPIRLVRRLVGPAFDAAGLLAVARSVARHRVVVKRPTSADPVAADPSFTINGKLVRYDVYVTATAEPARRDAAPTPG